MLFCIPLVTTSYYAGAQATTTGNLSGTVTDSSGASIPGATLVITNAAVGSTRQIKANEQGAYTFADLQVGTYQLTSTAPGFATSIVKSVAIDTGRSSNLNVTMVIGATSQEVTVTSDHQVLETTTNTLAATINPDAVQDLPLSGRDASPLTQLAPGAQTTGDARYATFNALPSAAINITIDGMNSNFQKFRTNTSGNYSPAPVRLGAIEEVSVSTSDLTADSGAEGSVALRFQIKRGTNKYHGSAFWQHQNSALNANTYANDAKGVRKTPTHLNDEGGNIGGPIFKNKLFFFANYEQEFVPGKTLATGYTLTPGAQAGNITYTGTDKILHSANVLSVAAQNNFASSINARIASELSQINQYNQSSVLTPVSALPYQDIATWNYATESKNIYPTGRIDYQITPSIDFHVAYDLWWRTLPGTQTYNGDPYTTGAFRSSYSTLTAGLDWTINSHLVNQINAGLLNDQERFNPTNSFTPYNAVNNVIYNSPTFISGGALVAPTIATNGLPEPRNNPVRDIFDNLTWTRGKHTFTFGGDFRNSTSHDLSISNPPPASLGVNTAYDPVNAIFNTTNFPGLDINAVSQQDVTNLKALYATLTGRISSISGHNNYDTATGQYKTLGDLVEKEAQTVGGFYFQDAWRPTPHLTLNYGMRWQFSGAIHNTNNIYTSPTYADLVGPSTGEFQPGSLGGNPNPQIGLRPSTYTGDFNQPAPNAGFAWNPGFDDGKLVIRGGAAISHYDEGWEVWENGSNTNPGLSQTASLLPGPVTNTPATQFAAGSLSLGVGTPALNTSPASFNFPLSQSNYTFSNTFSAVDPNIRSPYIETWNLGVQYKLPYDTVFEANYVGNHAVHMWMSYNINEVNIFENGFLSEFQKAQANLTANGGATAKGASFYGTNLPIMSQAFGGSSGTAFTNSTYINYVSTGQAGALANAIVLNSAYFCNLVGGSFKPCAALGRTSNGTYPINMFTQNPFSVSPTASTATLVSDPGSSNYNGLQTQLKHPVGHGLTLQINYAYSHAFSNRYTGASDTASNNFFTLRNRGLNRGSAPSDERHALKAYGVYMLPYHPHNSLLREVAGNWAVSPVVTWQTGRNFLLQGGTETFNTSDSGVVLNGISVHQLQKQVGYYPQRSTSNPLLLMNPAAFSLNGGTLVSSPSTPGVLGQYVYLHGPQFFNTDLAVSKFFPLVEGLKLNFQAEMLNIFNHPNFSIETVGGSNSGAQFASIQTSPIGNAVQNGGPRSIQFRLQLVY